MPSHDPHDEIADAGLADGCERCDEIAENPVAYLDGENFRALWAKMISVEYDDQAATEAPTRRRRARPSTRSRSSSSATRSSTRAMPSWARGS